MTGIQHVPPALRVALVHKVIEQVRAGHWTPDYASDELRALGLSASPPRVGAAAAGGLGSRLLARRLANVRWDVLEGSS